ncbi:sensor histidine kinase [Hoeflea prorocentri]|uniref:C4-dicarboxylate transport sensor protein n=1 Tax=Hoeflea prorocentri TaxID=1922333 RepID=A0A9X3ZIJ6_9HYPH|nr:ATP-binding protein [Hoeflea prorocentri]MCY6382078.1 ATP-binding protein [Hoeflea prorocentri]MDA5399878.1 ATP-binding protein [Hoeflea prorocentri]
MSEAHLVKLRGERRRPFVYIGVFLFAIAICVLVFTPVLERYFLLQTGRGQAVTLRLAVDSLRLTLDRYSRIPALIAARPAIAAFLQDPQSATLKADTEKLLSETATALGAKGVYLEDANGQILASSSSRFDDPLGAVADRFYRPYFDRVVAGGIGQYFALATTSGESGYFYATPVRSKGRIKGIVAVRFSVNQFEANLRGGASEIIVRDSNDIVFISSRDDWNLRSFTALDEDAQNVIAAARQYPLELLRDLPNRRTELERNIELFEINDGRGATGFVTSTSLIARAGWRVTILSPASEARALARLTAIGIFLFALLIAAITLLIWQRQARMRERFDEQREAKRSLEIRVEQRTQELNESNRQLVEEIEERKATEKQLRQTQTELIQAGKLAALGQMSAAISHEFNQPLAATKAYAENAVAFLDRNRDDDARSNVSRIVSMVDRMSSIAKHLRNFARRPQEKTKPVSVSSVLSSAIELMQPQLTKNGAELLFSKPPDDPWVIGGDIRLQQVVINLMRNALDAMTETAAPKIYLNVETEDETVRIVVIDDGTGLPDEVEKQVFDPFFSTKDPGQGMGLGLSISYNIIKDFGGRLSAENASGHGAKFTIELLRANSSDMKDAAE